MRALRHQSFYFNYIHLIFFAEFDVLATFKSHPRSRHGDTTGGPLEINGCVLEIDNPFAEPYQIFYLFNSIEKISMSLPVSLVQISTSLSNVVFPPYQRNTSSYEDQGFYQCGFTVGNGASKRTILSNTTDVQFAGTIS